MKINLDYIFFKIFQIATLYVFFIKLLFPAIILIGMIFLPHNSPMNKVIIEVVKYTVLTIVSFILTSYFEVKYKMSKEKTNITQSYEEQINEKGQ